MERRRNSRRAAFCRILRSVSHPPPRSFLSATQVFPKATPKETPVSLGVALGVSLGVVLAHSPQVRTRRRNSHRSAFCRPSRSVSKPLPRSFLKRHLWRHLSDIYVYMYTYICIYIYIHIYAKTWVAEARRMLKHIRRCMLKRRSAC